MARQDFLPDYLPPTPTRHGIIQFPGLRIVLENDRTAAEYLKQRAFVDETRRLIGSAENTFLHCGLTGFLIPFVPSLLGFRPFGKGIGGFIRSILVASVTANYAASWGSRIYEMKLRAVEKDRFHDKSPDRSAVLFHFSERIRIKNLLYHKAGMALPKPFQANNLHPKMRVYIRKVQLQLWQWKTSLHYFFWTDRIEQGWQEVFADETFRNGIEKRWKEFLQIPDPKPEDIVFEGVAAPTEKMWLSTPPGEFLNRKYASLLTKKQREFMREWSKSQCIKAYDSFSENFFDYRVLEEDAREYISNDSGKPRDYIWEEEFSKKYYEARNASQKAMSQLLTCEQWNKALRGNYFFAQWAPEDSIKVLRLAESAKVERERLEKEREEALAVQSVQEMSDGKLPVLHTESRTASPSINEPPAQVTKPEKKMKEENKKTDVKGKDETGVENS